MSQYSNISKLRVVRVHGTNPFVFSVRAEVEEGVEVDVAHYRHRTDADQFVEKFKGILTTSNPVLAAVGMMAICNIYDLSDSIAQASDTQGEARYATKAHMRDWAARIRGICKQALGSAGLLDEEIRL